MKKGMFLIAATAAGIAAVPAWAQSAPQSAPPTNTTMPGNAPADLPSQPTMPTAGDLQFHLAAGVASDYRFRSISQTDRKPFGYGLVSAQWKNFYVRAGGENVDFNNGTKAEYDVYGGWAPTFGSTSLDLGVVRYGYISGPRHPGKDTLEYKAGITQKIGKGTIGAVAYYAPDFLTLNTRALYTEINGSYAILPRVTASALIGLEQIHGYDNFKAWNIGATYVLTKTLGLDLRYYDTDSHQDGTAYHSAFVVALKFAI